MSSSGGSSGGSTAGANITRHFPFAYNTANILTGATLYTPTVGDIIHDAWIEIDTVWNGTTPKGDIGTFTGDPGFTGGAGLFASLSTGALDMTAADQVEYDPGFKTVDAVGTRNPALHNGTPRVSPGKVTTNSPIKVVVSQNGTNVGLAPGSTQGAAILYLVTSTPT